MQILQKRNKQKQHLNSLPLKNNQSKHRRINNLKLKKKKQNKRQQKLLHKLKQLIKNHNKNNHKHNHNHNLSPAGPVVVFYCHGSCWR